MPELAREIPRPARKNAGLRDDAAVLSGAPLKPDVGLSGDFQLYHLVISETQ